MSDEPIMDRRVSDAHLKATIREIFRELSADSELSQAYWKRGFVEISNHTSNAASQWLGKRILTMFVVAITSAGILWLAKTGAIK